MTVRIIHGDCLEETPKLSDEGVVVDAIVTDAPYHLLPTVKRFGKPNSAPAQAGRDGAMGRLSAGFMSATWDGGDIAFRPETWAAFGEVLRPGGFVLAFGGTRTYHRLTCAIEDAGFVIQDCLMWVFATGFPKRRDMLKPAYEPIVLAYKPGGKRTVQVDECRIDSPGGLTSGGPCIGRSALHMNAANGVQESRERSAEHPAGRWPANVMIEDCDEVIAAFPTAPGAQGRVLGTEPSESTRDVFGAYQERAESVPRGDSGSAARFFFSAKADKTDRWGSKHPTVKPISLMKHLVALVTPPNGTVLDPFAGSGTTGVAALATGRDAILIEQSAEYVLDIRERIAFYAGEGRHSIVSKNRSRQDKPGTLI